MKKAFSLIELIVSMVILAFVFSIVPMLLNTTLDNTKTILDQDKSVKLQEFYSILNVLPFDERTDIQHSYVELNGYKRDTQFGEELLGSSDKYIIFNKTDNNSIDYIGKKYESNGASSILKFNNGKRKISFKLNPYSGVANYAKWKFESNNITSSIDGVKIIKMTIKDKTDNTENVSMYGFFSDIGRKNSRFYTEVLPFAENNNIINRIKEQLK